MRIKGQCEKSEEERGKMLISVSQLTMEPHFSPLENRGPKIYTIGLLVRLKWDNTYV